MRQSEYLDTMESLLGHPGWKIIEDDARRQIYQLQADALDLKVCKNWDDVCVSRGKAETLAEILMMSQVIANQRDVYNELGRQEPNSASV
jgi:hypothetical protein